MIYEEAEKVLTITYLHLLNWVRRWLPDAQAQVTAATSMTTLVREAMHGRKTQYGPWKSLYQTAELGMRWWGQANGYDVPFGVWRTVPLPLPELLCQLSRVYAHIYQCHELAQISMPEEDVLLKMLWSGRYNEAGHWTMPFGDPDIPVVSALMDRALTAQANHACRQYDGCQEFADLWHHEDRRSSIWLCGFRPHARENVHGL
jgi:hypothetical protein